MKKPVLTLVALLLFIVYSFTSPPTKKQEPEFLSLSTRWADSVFNSLTPDQRLAQLFMVAAYSNRDGKHEKEIKELITKYQIGGLIWMQGSPVREAKLSSYFQSLSKVPLLYSIDGEWGLSMRLDSTPRYPRQMTLGAIQNDSLIFQMGIQVARDCKRMGIHVNFAPDADINNNPLNPVIGMRSFGEDKHRVAIKSAMYMKGMQAEHVMATGKHFPGHGDTESDSHSTLPEIKKNRQTLDSLELFPFRFLIREGLASMMVAHLNIPALDSTKNTPSSLSPKVINGLLKQEYGFKGLIFTDALNMKGVAAAFEPGRLEVQALLAGNDVLLFSANVPKALDEIKKAIASGILNRDELDQRVKKILQAKFWCGLNQSQQIVTRNLTKELNSKESSELNEKLAKAAITVLKNDNQFLPVKRSDTLKIIEVSFGIEEPSSLFLTLKNYAYAEHAGLSHNASMQEIMAVFEKVNDADIAIIQLNKATAKPDNNYGVGKQTFRLIDSMASLKPSVLVIHTNPYVLNSFKSVNRFKAVVVGYEYLPAMLKASANAILGLQEANGQLPVSTNLFPLHSGLSIPAMSPSKQLRLKEEFLSKKFAAIDSIALSGIAEKAYPGCQIVAIKDGEIIYQKSFGTFTYNKDSKPVDNGTLYDLASITKIAASSFALMKLQSEGKFDYKKNLGDYLPELQGTNKEKLRIEDVLSHQAGLQAWIPFYLKSIDKSGRYRPGYYNKKMNEEFPIPVAKNLYAVKGFNDSIYDKVLASKIENPGKYLYSDLGYYFMQRIIESQTQQPLNKYVGELYFKLGLGLTYHPLQYLSKTQIAPTENDEKFRKQIVQGYVHDPGAALMGGVAGHAGLFGNALDVARLMQFFLNKGQLNGERLLDSNVVKDFTSCHFCPQNRRGLCFEKPETDPKKDSPVTSECSPESFGHAGFTGTFAWADPKNKLVFVFLSNRVYPNAEENKLTKLGIRGKIHKAFYEATR